MLQIGKIDEYIKNRMQAKEAMKTIFEPVKKEPTIADAMYPDKSPQAVITYRITLLSSSMESGVELSAQDLAFLRDNAPTLYAKALLIAKERKELAQRLRTCRSKQEALDVKSTYTMSVAASVVGSTGGGGAYSGAQGADMRMSAINTTYSQFQKTKQYKELPHSAIEKKKEEQKQQKKKRFSQSI